MITKKSLYSLSMIALLFQMSYVTAMDGDAGTLAESAERNFANPQVQRSVTMKERWESFRADVEDRVKSWFGRDRASKIMGLHDLGNAPDVASKTRDELNKNLQKSLTDEFNKSFGQRKYDQLVKKYGNNKPAMDLIKGAALDAKLDIGDEQEMKEANSVDL